ncbi:MAG: hypothetical protein ACO2Z9_04540 [Crocinitomicaceae bacterium]
MKNYTILLVSLFALIAQTSWSADFAITPPDSTSNIVDRTAAAYLIDEGRTFYNQGKVKNALTKFREAAIKDPYSWRASFWIGKCHYRLGNFGYAVRYANDAITLGGEKVDKEVYYNVALAYHQMAKLDSALMNYDIAVAEMPKGRLKELSVAEQRAKCLFATEAMKSEPNFVRKGIRGFINGGFDEYGVVLADTGNTLYFTSRRNNTTGGGMNPDDQLYFEDIYRASKDPGTGDWDDITNDLGRLNSDGFEALNYLSPDGLWGIVTLNNTATEEGKKATRGSDICEIKKNTKGVFNKPKAISNKTINTSFFEGAATLTADGNTMYFVTDRKGAKSSTDIYMVQRNGKSWGEAEPLPFHINTTGRETTPYISPDGRYLFFSSDGHEGMGGLDIYVVENKGGEWGTPVNLGYGINTVNNDTHFVYDEASKMGYISGSELVGNKSSLNIFEMDLTNFKIPEPPKEEKK